MIRLTPPARALFPDLGARPGVLLRREGAWVVTRWPPDQATVWLRAEDVEGDGG